MGVPIAMAWGLFVRVVGCACLEALNAGSPFWGADEVSFLGMCASAALWRVVLLGMVVGAFAFWGTSR